METKCSKKKNDLKIGRHIQGYRFQDLDMLGTHSNHSNVVNPKNHPQNHHKLGGINLPHMPCNAGGLATCQERSREGGTPPGLASETFVAAQMSGTPSPFVLLYELFIRF